MKEAFLERKYFGTDGIRGRANSNPMTIEIAMKVGQAAGQLFREKSPHARPTVVIGKDTRVSGYMVESALQAGFTSVGFYTLLVGPLPTPAVSFLTRSLRADLGVMISASHNEFADNGIKLFGPDGFKLPDSMEHEIESFMDGVDGRKIDLMDAAKIGKAVRIEDAVGRYIESCKMAFSNDFRLDGMRIVIDCANGAAYKIAPKILWELGAQVIRIGAEPDGYNINRKCGALHTKGLKKAVLNHGADIGIALDGDADRLIICDELGNIIDGDQIMATVASYLNSKGLLKGKGVVATQMSNMGLEKYLEGEGMHLVRTNVGDRYVMEGMIKGGYNFGGEASGHMILLDHATTGDGLLAALKFLEVLRAESTRASVLGKRFTPFPQRLENVTLPSKDLANQVINAPAVQDMIAQVEEEMADEGRVLIRKSGTEPLVRVMVEGADAEKVDDAVERIAAKMRASL
ncbi:MAG: phosphoglucosamine mutase [bacterium]|jgi:phosphoglucosamine mutase